jgi:hypothetical protein
MAIIGDHPETGIRLVLERPRDGGPPWIYVGEAFTPTAAFDARVRVEAGGDVDVTLTARRIAPADASAAADSTAPAEPMTLPRTVADQARLIVRTAYRTAQTREDGPAALPSPPPRRIVRWRGDK